MRRWLALSAVATTSIVVLAFLLPLAALIRDLAADRALASAERDAQTVAQLAATLDDTPDAVHSLEIRLPADASIQLAPGEVIGAALPPGLDLSQAATLGEASRQPVDRGQAVVVPVLKDNAAWVVVISVPTAVLMENVVASWLVLAALGLALIAVAALVADRLGRSIVHPIQNLVAATERLGAGELDASVTPSGPAELVQVGAAFNHLSHRVAQLLAGERESIADLSHRLRTPLTALKLDVEALEASVDVSRLQEDIDELERTVSHLINEARRPIREGAGAFTELTAVVAGRAKYWGSLAEDQGRKWDLELPDNPCRVAGRDTDFVAAIDALIGNIFAHTPVGSPYSIKLSAKQNRAILAVTDQGPGLADRELLERGRSSAESTGLGIDIVRNTAAAASGSAEWTSVPTGGTTVRISLPLI